MPCLPAVPGYALVTADIRDVVHWSGAQSDRPVGRWTAPIKGSVADPVGDSLRLVRGVYRQDHQSPPQVGDVPGGAELVQLT